MSMRVRHVIQQNYTIFDISYVLKRSAIIVCLQAKVKNEINTDLGTQGTAELKANFKRNESGINSKAILYKVSDVSIQYLKK